jgi:hypothetical protein
VKLLDVREDVVEVRFGPFFRADVPRDEIIGVAVVKPSRLAGVGAHYWRGAWVVNTRFGEAVELTTASPVPIRVLGVPLKARRIQVVVDDPRAVERELLPT